MPTYDYACGHCQHRFELFQSMTAKIRRKCPECGEKALERLIGPGAGFLFKGDGFYTTDYRSMGYQDAKKEDKPKDKPKDGGKDGGAGKSSEKTTKPAPDPKKP